MNDLKPCPFCGETPILDGEYYRHSCSMAPLVAKASGDFIERWNTRIPLITAEMLTAAHNYGMRYTNSLPKQVEYLNEQLQPKVDE